MLVILTQNDLNNAAVFPPVFQTPKLEGMGKKKAKNQICLKLNCPTEITTKNTEHSLLGKAALICTNRKYKILEVYFRN